MRSNRDLQRWVGTRARNTSTDCRTPFWHFAREYRAGSGTAEVVAQEHQYYYTQHHALVTVNEHELKRRGKERIQLLALGVFGAFQ